MTTTVPLDEFCSCPCVSVAEVSQSGYCTPNAHIPLLSRMTGLKFTPSDFILAMKYQTVIDDPTLWLSRLSRVGLMFKEVRSVLVATLMSPHVCFYIQIGPQIGMSSDLRFNQGTQLQLKISDQHLLCLS